MKEFSDTFPAQPFFLKADPGQRFCLFHKPYSKECHGAILYIHPFGDEMNKSRRMAALQARAFAAAGFGVLQIDLFGCGDSSGEFGDARWDIWKQDLTLARNWLEDRISAPVSLLGLRLGALLALDFARNETYKVDRLVLWQPVVSGESFLNQFLRLRMANDMLAAPGAEKTPGTGTNTMRQCLADGKMLEVAGYDLAPNLAAAIDSLRAAELAVGNHTIHWFEIAAEPGRSITPAGSKVVAEWKRRGIDPHVHVVSCPPFWMTQEVSECPELILATVNAFVTQ